MNVREHPAVVVSREEARGCGFRKAGGIYLVGDGPSNPCGRLPLLCEKCPCCGAGIKPTRGWTWIDLRALTHDLPTCPRCGSPAVPFIAQPPACPMSGQVERAGLIWVGTRFYSTPDEFLQEATRMGISRRLPAVPRDFKVGETWILLAHRNHPVPMVDKTADPGGLATEPKTAQMIFSAYRPQRIEQVLRGDESVEEIDALVKRGIRPVVVERVGEQTTIPEAADTTADDSKPCFNCPFGVERDGDPACDTCEAYAKWDRKQQKEKK